MRYVVPVLLAAVGLDLLLRWSTPLIGVGLLGLACVIAWPDGRRLRVDLGPRDAEEFRKERRGMQRPGPGPRIDF